MADRVPRQERGCQLVDHGDDHGVEIGDLVVQLEVAPRQRAERDPVSGNHIAIVRQVRPPGGQGSDELHAGHLTQRLPQLIGRGDDRVVDHLQGDAAAGHGRLAAGLEHTQGLDHAVAALRRNGAAAGKGGMRCVLGIKVVVLAAPAAILRVGRGDLEHFDAGALQVAEQPGAVGPCRLDADALEHPEGAHPGEHLLVAVPGRWEASARQHPVLLVDNGSDMKVLVGVDPTDDKVALVLRVPFHAGSPGSPGCGWLHRDRMPGQDSHATKRQALLGSPAPARRNLAARRLGGRQVRGRTRIVVDQSAGQTAPRRLAASATLAGRSL
jgi:hypothetical protein